MTFGASEGTASFMANNVAQEASNDFYYNSRAEHEQSVRIYSSDQMNDELAHEIVISTCRDNLVIM